MLEKQGEINTIVRLVRNIAAGKWSKAADDFKITVEFTRTMKTGFCRYQAYFKTSVSMPVCKISGYEISCIRIGLSTSRSTGHKRHGHYQVVLVDIVSVYGLWVGSKSA